MAVKAFLVTYDYNLAGTQARLAQFARSLCINFDSLQSQGHPKWKEVDLVLPKLQPGWAYYGPTAQELRKCTGKSKATTARPPSKSCSAEERILGFCN